MNVTDHALVRYIVRKKGVDLGELCPNSATDAERLAHLSLFHGLDIERSRDEVAGFAKTGVDLGAKAVLVAGMKFVLKGRHVVTCY